MERASWVAAVFGLFVALGAWIFPDPLNLAPLAAPVAGMTRSEAFLSVAARAVVFFAASSFLSSMLARALYVPYEYRSGDGVLVPFGACIALTVVFLVITAWIAYRVAVEIG